MARRAMFGETCFLFHVPPNMARLWPRAKGMAWPFFETLTETWPQNLDPRGSKPPKFAPPEFAIHSDCRQPAQTANDV